MISSEVAGNTAASWEEGSASGSAAKNPLHPTNIPQSKKSLLDIRFFQHWEALEGVNHRPKNG